MISEGKSLTLKAKLTPESEKEIKDRLKKLNFSNIRIIDDYHVVLAETSKYNPVSPISFTCKTRMNDLKVSGNKLILNLRDSERTLTIMHKMIDAESDFTSCMVIACIDNITYSEMSQIVETLNFVNIEFNRIEF